MLARQTPNKLNEWDEVLKTELRKVNWLPNLTQHIPFNFWVPTTNVCKVYRKINAPAPGTH